MRIAVWHNLPSGGGKRALYYHIRGLLERGHYVESWCPPTADQSYLPLRTLIKEHVIPFVRQPKSARWFSDPGLTFYRNVTTKLTIMDQHCRQCAEEINQREFDVLFANSCLFFRVTSIGRYVTMPSVLYLQEPYRWLYEALPELPWPALPPPPRSWWTPGYLRFFLSNLIKVQGLRIQAREEIVNARTFHTVLVNSYFSRESVLRAYGLDAKVCYLGVDTDMFVNYHLPKKGFVIGVGGFVPEKNIDFVIRALSRIPPPRPPLLWVGNSVDQGYLSNLKRLAANCDVDFQPRVQVDDDELVRLYNQSTLMVYAPRLEPFGLVPLEANACGLPVVAVAEGGVRETVIDGVNGLLVDHDIQAMADAVHHLIQSPAYARQLGETGMEIVKERWSWQAATERLEKYLKQCRNRCTPA